jgi:hypothetical protein
MRLMITALLLTLASAALGQRHVTSISVAVRIAKANGTPLSGLTHDDVEVLEDGQPRQIEAVTPDTDPLALVVLLDLTRSTWPGRF